MPDNLKILAAIKPLQYQGENRFKEKWPDLIASLRSLLQKNGFEDNKSSEELLLFTFNHPHAAISSIYSSLSKLKNAFNEAAPDEGVTVLFMLHLPQAKEINNPICNPDDELWDLLKPEIIYITRSLKPTWEILTNKKQLPPCTITKESDSCYKLKFSENLEIRNETLLSFRGLPLKGELKECFYCGMKSHKPSACPSKLITMEINGLNEIGYLPFEKINLIYKAVFNDQEKITRILVAGIKPGNIRKDPGLTVYLAFLDITKTYQLRFLWNMAFSLYTKWESVFEPKKLTIDNANLQLGLDCLRVQQYSQAEELLVRETNAKAPKRFYATVGLAFLDLERGRLSDMRNHLELAANLAIQEKERIYIALMLSRFYDLNNETWKGRDIIKNILTLKNDCQETLYRKIQLEVKGNFTEDAYQQLRSLMSAQRSLYMAVLMDSSLIPIQSKVEGILLSQYQTLLHSAQTNLANANNDITDLRLWFKDNEKQMQTNIKTLQNLTKRLERKSYYDVLDVSGKAKGLLAASKSLREQKLNELYNQINKATSQWKSYYNFGARYRFPNFFKKFYTILNPLKAKLNQAKVLAKQNRGETYREAVQILKEANKILGSLKPIYERMNWVNFICSASLIFAKKLIITEVAVAIAAIVLMMILTVLPSTGALSGLSALSQDSLFQKRAIFFMSVLLSPLVAFAWTLTKMNKSS